MSQKTLRITLPVIGSIFSVAWLVDSVLHHGKGFVSTYFAPLAFGPIIIASVMARNEKNRS